MLSWLAFEKIDFTYFYCVASVVNNKISYYYLHGNKLYSPSFILFSIPMVLAHIIHLLICSKTSICLRFIDFLTCF